MERRVAEADGVTLLFITDEPVTICYESDSENPRLMFGGS